MGERDELPGRGRFLNPSWGSAFLTQIGANIKSRPAKKIPPLPRSAGERGKGKGNVPITSCK